MEGHTCIHFFVRKEVNSHTGDVNHYFGNDQEHKKKLMNISNHDVT